MLDSALADYKLSRHPGWPYLQFRAFDLVQENRCISTEANVALKKPGMMDRAEVRIRGTRAIVGKARPLLYRAASAVVEPFMVRFVVHARLLLQDADIAAQQICRGAQPHRSSYSWHVNVYLICAPSVTFDADQVLDTR
jgi:hypothetical protein